MKLSNDSVSLIDQCLLKLAEDYTHLTDELITDFHFMPMFETGELVVYNDDDEELHRLTIPEWLGLNAKTGLRDAENGLRKILENHRKQLEKLSVIKPYSFVLVDLQHETLCELMLVDEELMLAPEPLLEGLNEELDDFLKQLLAE